MFPTTRVHGGRRPTRLAAAALTLALGAAASVGTASATTDATLDRLAGQDRYETAAAVAGATFDSATTVFLASGADFPDALAANGAAGAHAAPVLLVGRSFVPAATTQQLAALGATEVVLVGGTDAIDASVQDELAADYDVRRIAGDTRYETAAALALEIEAIIGVGAFEGRRAAFLAVGDVFADSLSVGPLAYGGVIPMLLTETNALPQITAETIQALQIETVIIAGGTAAVSEQVEAAVEALGATTIRLAGIDRQATAVEVADFGTAQFGLVAERADIATGFKFPDGLVGGQHNGQLLLGPVLLTNGETLGDPASDWLTANCGTVSEVVALGGTVAVPEDVAQAALAAARSC